MKYATGNIGTKSDIFYRVVNHCS